MDVFTQDFWKSQWDVIASAPWLVVPLLAAAAYGGWLLRGSIAKGKIDGLIEQLKVRDDRLAFAQEKERDLKANLAVATSQASSAKESVRLFVKDDPRLLPVQSSIESSVAAIKQAVSSSDALSSELLKPIDRELWVANLADLGSLTKRSD